ncbi:hypothetical protein PbB2_00170 [Candidatus Phycosocius bacilliformis]|uniref:Uncharacterized protein n=1 Tax=Candidatus Phycosocius bacilliformis TaxID=1445552 RepID=A0A2P2E631_9PROT|nr:hypothetical protein PbB2_00170 [Candidatus Phycosocius bacilliformis]
MLVIDPARKRLICAQGPDWDAKDPENVPEKNKWESLRYDIVAHHQRRLV